MRCHFLLPLAILCLWTHIGPSSWAVREPNQESIPPESHTQTWAVVLDVRGTVRLESDSEDNATETKTEIVGRQQLGNESVRLEKGASLLLAFTANGEMQRLTAIDAAVTTRLSETGATAVEGLKINPIPGKIPSNSLAFLSAGARMGVGQARSEIDPPGPPVSPIHRSVVLTNQPALSWPGQAGVDEYKIVVFKAGSRRKVFSTSTANTQVNISAALQPGSYQWRITGVAAGTADQEIAPYIVDRNTRLKSFVVATPAVVDDLNQLTDVLSAAGESPGLLAFVAQRMKQEGAWEPAIELFQRLQEKKDFRVEALVELNELYRLAGRLEQAVQARVAAESLGYRFEKTTE